LELKVELSLLDKRLKIKLSSVEMLLYDANGVKFETEVVGLAFVVDIHVDVDEVVGFSFVDIHVGKVAESSFVVVVVVAAAAAKYFLTSCKCWRLIPRNREKVQRRTRTSKTNTQRLMTNELELREVSFSIVVLNDSSSPSRSIELSRGSLKRIIITI
jgi:hypothetical protein